jgi:hypothetical protein
MRVRKWRLPSRARVLAETRRARPLRFLAPTRFSYPTMSAVSYMAWNFLAKIIGMLRNSFLREVLYTKQLYSHRQPPSSTQNNMYPSAIPKHLVKPALN